MRLKTVCLVIFAMFWLVILLQSVSALECATFQDSFDVIWSSELNYTQESMRYYNWKPGFECPGTDCFMQRINTFARVIDFDPDETLSGYIQIANADESNCENASKAKYSTYAAHKTIADNETSVFAWTCSTQNSDLCSLTANDGYTDDASCFSVKMWAKNYALTDMTRINYTWCWGEPEDAGSNKMYFWLTIPLAVITIFVILRRKHEA